MRVALVLLLSIVACDRAPPPVREDAGPPIVVGGERSLRISGSSAGQPLLEAAKERFETRYKGKSVELSAGGSSKGVSDVVSGAVQIGSSDVFADAPGLIDHRIAVVGFAAMANKGPWNAGVASLSKEVLAKIFTGKITDWKDAGGTAQPIVVINRAVGSGSRRVFGNVILGSDKFVETQTEDNSGQLVAKLKLTRGAISYVALPYRDPELLVFALSGVEPTEASIIDGTWPLWSYEHLYTKGEPTGLSKIFVDWLLGQEFQGGVLPSIHGYIPIAKMTVRREKDG